MICGIIRIEFINTKPTHVSVKAYKPLRDSTLSTFFCKHCKFSYSCVIGITVTEQLRLEGPPAESRANFEARSNFRGKVGCLGPCPVTFVHLREQIFYSFSVIPPPSIHCFTTLMEIFLPNI